MPSAKKKGGNEFLMVNHKVEMVRKFSWNIFDVRHSSIVATEKNQARRNDEERGEAILIKRDT